MALKLASPKRNPPLTNLLLTVPVSRGAQLLEELAMHTAHEILTIVNCGPGSGKTLLAVSWAKVLADPQHACALLRALCSVSDPAIHVCKCARARRAHRLRRTPWPRAGPPP